ncbi:MAG: hypothetical protein ACRDT0_11530 [Pseudonocardiaceae bacterium]
MLGAVAVLVSGCGGQPDPFVGTPDPCAMVPEQTIDEVVGEQVRVVTGTVEGRCSWWYNVGSAAPVGNNVVVERDLTLTLNSVDASPLGSGTEIADRSLPDSLDTGGERVEPLDGVGDEAYISTGGLFELKAGADLRVGNMLAEIQYTGRNTNQFGTVQDLSAEQVRKTVIRVAQEVARELRARADR